MTRVLVTGARGFLGGAILRRLAARGDEVLAAGRPDLVDEAAVVAALTASRPDIVVHAAGRTHGSGDELAADNVALTRRLAETLVATSPETWLILLGSAAQYGPSQDWIPWREDAACRPYDAYGASKLEAERAAFEAGAMVTALRIFNVVSPTPHGAQVFSTFLRKAAEAYSDRCGWQIELGPLDAVRDFVALDDVATAIERTIDRGVGATTINICTGQGRTVSDLVTAVASELAPCAIRARTDLATPSLTWSIGDPSRCQALLGFTPSSDLTAVTMRAAAWVKAQAEAGAHAS
jgi:nucleoside-diphosphate-sugar epimerase